MASTKEKTAKGSVAAKSASASKKTGGSMILAGLFQFDSYKASQGRTVRLVTAVTFGVIIALGAWRLYETIATAQLPDSLAGMRGALGWAVPGLLLAAGWWFCYRIVNLPKFADFLIAVEAEMTKVSWPTQTELYRSSLVVIFFIVSLAALLFVFDLFWQTVFRNVLGI